MKTKDIQNLMKVMKENGVSRLDWRRGCNRLVLEQEIIKDKKLIYTENEVRSMLKKGRSNDVRDIKTVDAKDNTITDNSKNEDLKNIHLIKSPLIGTLYEAPDPDSAPFVKVNDVVKAGDTLCIVEAMKSMNEIKTDIGGTIVEIFGENGKLVEYNATLFKIKV